MVKTRYLDFLAYLKDPRMTRLTPRPRRSNFPAPHRLLLLAMLAAGAAAGFATAELGEPDANVRRISRYVARMLGELHLERRPIDDELSQKCLEEFLTTLDPMKRHFLQSDIDEFMQYSTEIDDQIKNGDVRLAYQIFKRYKERVKQRNEMVEEWIDADHDFTVDEQLITDSDALNYPTDLQEMRDRWRKRIKYELLMKKLEEVEIEEAREKLRRRYSSMAKRTEGTKGDELLEMYLSAMGRGLDPHTSYMSSSTLEDFEINMRLKLEGIGASLQFDDGLTVVHKIIPGGAADRDGRLQPGDHIVAVAADSKNEPVDVVEMRLRDVVEMIRGERGTEVRLGVQKQGKGPTEFYDITRDVIELKDSEARGEILEQGAKPDGTPYRIGWIDLPSFYMDMERARKGLPEFKSTTRDVRRILEEFKVQGVDSVVLDLRRNGGGSLTEAVNLTGLFIETGPVVMVKGFRGEVERYADPNSDIAWDGPLVVLISRFSASASEILAGAIQDYQRGLIVGDRSTHGKGTVQQLLDLGHYALKLRNAKMGALKVTIQQFYRPSGDSTQSRGVRSDIELPSLTSHLEGLGESDLDNALAFDRVESDTFDSFNFIDPNMVTLLRERSRERMAQSDEFQEALEEIERYNERKERKAVELKEEKFMADLSDWKEEEERKKELEELHDNDRKIFESEYWGNEDYGHEALAIAVDYVELLQKNRLAGAPERPQRVETP